MNEAGIWSDQVEGYLISVVFLLRVASWVRCQVAARVVGITHKLLMLACSRPGILALP